MTDNLSPCPFCDRVAEADHQQGYLTYPFGRLDHAAAIYCTSCNANMTICRADHPELSDEERMAILVENWNRRATAPAELSVGDTLNHEADTIDKLHAIKVAAAAYVASVNGEPEKDCWDTEDGKEAPGSDRFASDWSWKAYDDAKQKAFDALRAALSASEVKG